jgi:hypothetical protein
MKKAVFIIYAPAIECEIEGALDKNNIKHYTKMPYLHGVGGHSEPHLDTQVWPGSNMGLYIVEESTAIKGLMEDLKRIKQEFLEDGIKAFVMPVEDIL